MKLRWLWLLGCTLSFSLLVAQEQFIKWLDEDCFVVQRNTDDDEQFVKICLPKGKESNYREKSEPFERNNIGFLTLEDGRMIHERDQDLYMLYPDGNERQLTDDPAMERNISLSPDKNQLAYTKNQDLHVFDIISNEEIRLTDDASDSRYNGWASWVYYEEILGRPSNYKAFWWNPLGGSIAFLQFEDAPVPPFPIYHSTGQRGDLEVMRYPKAGDHNPSVRLGVVDVVAQEVIWIEEDAQKDQYTAWPFWTPDGENLIFQELNRNQDSLTFVLANPKTGKRTILDHITRPTWVEFVEEVHFLNDRSFLFLSDHEGWTNIYRLDIREGKIERLTQTSHNITSIESLDLAMGEVLFYAHGDDPRDRHFYRAKLASGTVQPITKGAGWHQVITSPSNKYVLDRYTLVDQSAREQIVDLKSGDVLYTLDRPREERGLVIESFTVPTEDGFDLPGYLVFPKRFDESKQYPVLFTPYGGPDRQEVTHQYRDLSRSYYANNDIIQVKVDHRGSGIFGRRGLDYLHRSLGQWEIRDLSTVVDWLKTKTYIDPSRIGITGGSYGGYLTSLALTLGADHFTHGVSLYPVTDWSLYDNVYTERYMDKPSDNPNGYMASSAMTHAHQYDGALLIVHGAVDENVHMQNTMQFVSVMQDLGKSFELMIYPGERHGWGGPKQSHLINLTQQFWEKHFKGK